MGVASRYPSNLIMPFLKSLRATSYQGRVCLLVGDMSAKTQNELRTVADDVVDLDGLYGKELARYHVRGLANRLAKLRDMRGGRRLYAPLFQLLLKRAAPARRDALRRDLEKRIEGFQSLRYTHYLNYIQQLTPPVDYVMLSDVRDVIFQRDPFDHHFDNDLEVFLESPSITIGNEPFNRGWIKNLYGEKTLHELSSNTVCCSGTTMGTRAGMERYLRLMIAELERHDRPLGSHDQGVHNFLLRTNQFQPVTIYHNGESPVLTMGMEAARMLSQNEEQEILNLNGQVAPVVHQYDRYPELYEQVKKKYS